MAEEEIRCINKKNNRVAHFKKHIVTPFWIKSTGWIPQPAPKVSRETISDKQNGDKK